MPEPHERNVPRGEGRRRRRGGEEICGGRGQAWDDLAERTQVRDSQKSKYLNDTKQSVGVLLS